MTITIRKPRPYCAECGHKVGEVSLLDTTTGWIYHPACRND